MRPFRFRRFLLILIAVLLILITLEVFKLSRPSSVENDDVVLDTERKSVPSEETPESVSSPPPPSTSINTTVAAQLATISSQHVVINESDLESQSLQHFTTNNISSLWRSYTGSSWSNPFCKSFLGITYDRSSTVCPGRIVCSGSFHSKKIGTCTMKDVGIKPRVLHDVMTTLKEDKIQSSDSVWLLGQNPCKEPFFKEVTTFIENVDPVLAIARMSTLSYQTSSCNRWINGTTFFYVGMAKHIYFRFLVWYNLYRSLRHHEKERDRINIVRLPELEGKFLFPELEEKLFGKVIPIQSLHDDIVCFEKIVLVAWAYGAPMFRCKMDGAAMKRRCLQCDGRNLNNTDMLSFRQHILSGCSLQDEPVLNHKTQTITIIERKRYERYKGDPQKKFKRIWVNSQDLILKLKETFPHVNVSGVYAETLPICEQIKLAHNTDLLIAMHGAGLVHLWWQQPGSKVLELVPKSQRGNGAFITLAKHLGRTHKLFNKVTEKGAIVSVDIDKLVKEVKNFIKS